MNADADRVAMHAVRRTLVRARADRLGRDVAMIKLPHGCPDEPYASNMSEALEDVIDDGVAHVVFAHLFLEDVRRYREERLSATPIPPFFPLWGEPTDRLAASFADAGARAIVTCVDPRKLPAAFAGRRFDAAFLAALPEGVDPCGEYGEFHTFVYDGPGFSSPIDVHTGEVVERDGFVFCDVLMNL